MIRFGGLATGQDTASIVQALLEVERAPINRLENEIVEAEEKYAAWTELDTKVSDLHTKTSKLTSYLTWRQNDVVSTDENVVSGSADHSAAQGTYSINVTARAQAHMIGSNSQTDTASALGLSGDFTLNGENITIASGDSLETIRDAINTASANMSDKVTATIINTTLVIERQDTGTTELDFSTDSGVAASLGLISGTPPAHTFTNELKAAQNLDATVNGIAVSSATNNNITSIISGVTLNFKGEGVSELEIDRDTDTIKTAFEEFVDVYNAVMELAEEQTQVTLSGSSSDVDSVGVLQGESSVSNIRFRGRAIITSSFDDAQSNGDFNTLQSIGLWTEGQENRLAIFSSDRLSDALENNFDEVETLVRDFDNGILKRFNSFTDEIQSPIDGTIARRQTSLRDEVNYKQDRIDELELLILDKEQELYEHYARMEASVGQIQSQGNYLSSTLG